MLIKYIKGNPGVIDLDTDLELLPDLAKICSGIQKKKFALVGF